MEGDFNTFRRGGAWSRRVSAGVQVGLLNLKTSKIMGYAVVINSRTDPLSILLERFAHNNHMVKHLHPDETEDELQKLLYRYYGKNYAAPDEVFSVIKMRKIDAEETQK